MDGDWVGGALGSRASLAVPGEGSVTLAQPVSNNAAESANAVGKVRAMQSSLESSANEQPTKPSPHTPEDSPAEQKAYNESGLRNGVHVLTSVLLIVALGYSVRLPQPDAVLNLVLCALFAFTYFFGAMWWSQWSARFHFAWIGVLSLLWGLLLPVAPVAIYLVFPLFFIYLQIIGGVAGVVAVVAIAVVAVVAQIPEGLTVGGVMGPSVSALVTLAIYYAFTKLARANQERQELIDQLMATRSELARTQHTAGVVAERQRIAHEIHDTLAQGLSSIQMLLHVAENDIEGSSLSDAEQAAPLKRITLARTVAADNLSEARAMIAALQPAALSTASLHSALQRVADNHGAVSGVDFEVDVDGADQELAMREEAALLRIAQGAVANVVAHSEATRCRISLSYGDTEVRLDVVDNGQGFDPEDVARRPAGLGHVGLAAMRQRAGELAGVLTVESAPGEGTAISVALPRTKPGGPAEQ